MFYSPQRRGGAEYFHMFVGAALAANRMYAQDLFAAKAAPTGNLFNLYVSAPLRLKNNV